MNVNQSPKHVSMEEIVDGRAIGPGLVCGLLILIFIIVGVDYSGLSTMKRLHAQAQSIADDQWTDVELATAALNLSNHNGRIIMQLAVTTDREEMNSLLRRRTDNSEKVSKIVKQLHNRIGSAEERRLYDAIVSSRTSYLKSAEYPVRILLTGKDTAKAQASLVQVTMPLLLQYHSAWNDFVDFQKKEMTRQLLETSTQYAAARKRAVYLIWFSVLLAGAIAGVLILRIMAEVHHREFEEHKIQRLNEELEHKVSHRTIALEMANEGLTAEIGERKRIEEKLRAETAFLEAQTNSTLDGILVVDSNNRIILRNQRFVEILQVPPGISGTDDDQALLEHAVSMVKNPEEFLHKVRHLYNHRHQTSCDEVQFNNGMIVDRYSSPVIDKQGKYYGRIWTFRDITERKRNEEEVRRLSLAVEQSPVSVVITSLSGDIVYVNRKFVESTGYAYDEVIGKNPRILKSGHTKQEEYKKLWETIRAGGEWRGEFQNRRKNGEPYWEYAVIRPIEDENGKATHFLALKEDITERRRMEVQLQHAQRLEAIGQLASGIAHEINTPTQYIGDNVCFLTGAFQDLRNLIRDYDRLLGAVKNKELSYEIAQEVSSALERIDADYLLEEIPKALAQTTEGISRVSNLVGAMKEFSHPGTKEKTACDLNRAIESTITVSRNEWKYVSDLETDFDPLLPSIPCVPSEFNQVILNMIVNAAHAIGDVVDRESGNKGRIKVKTLNCTDWAEIRIQDTGTGIPKQVQDHIFEPFFTTKEVGKGTGQGLAIARSIIVDKHLGSIHFETEEGKGTTFIIRLPHDGKSLAAKAVSA
jgi:PAS domain S-box-containing protein